MAAVIGLTPAFGDVPDGIYTAMIATAPTQPAPASTVAYGVRVITPGGMLEFSAVKPARLRLSDSVNIVPARVNDIAVAHFVGGRVFFDITEQPDTGECQPPSP